MSQCFFIALERRERRGWAKVAWPQIPKPPGGKYAFEPYEFYDRVFFYVLSSVEYRIDPSDCPKPLVARPRGRPADISPKLAKAHEEETWILHWLWPSEVLLYDWHAYEYFETEQHHHMAKQYEKRHGRPYPHDPPGHYVPHEFLDVIAALDPFDGHRLILGME